MTDTATAAPDAPPTASSVAELAEQVDRELATLDAELTEIDMLINQATTEAGRHELRRAQAVEKLDATASKMDPADALEATRQQVLLTRRAAVMEAQVDVLKGKQRALSRFRDALAAYSASLGALATAPQALGPGSAAAVEPPPAPSRTIIRAQDDLRREIARAMHDGPAQSLTNIALQAQIVERLVGRDEAMARGELRLLMSMVQQTLDATKSFIFDVRPMVLDDLGIVPTLRRTASERGRRSRVPVTCESDGQDRRLPVDVEGAIFRIVDDALAAYLERSPDRVAIRLGWSEALTVEVQASRDERPEPEDEPGPPAPDADVPPALAAMIEDQRAAARGAAPEPLTLDETTWRDLAARAEAIGLTAELGDDGGRVRLVVPLSTDGEASPAAES
jgi:two-component system sensor histidine kinase DegS